MVGSTIKTLPSMMFFSELRPFPYTQTNASWTGSYTYISSFFCFICWFSSLLDSIFWFLKSLLTVWIVLLFLFCLSSFFRSRFWIHICNQSPCFYSHANISYRLVGFSPNSPPLFGFILSYYCFGFTFICKGP